MPSVLPSLLKLDHGMFKKDFDLSEEVRSDFVYCIISYTGTRKILFRCCRFEISQFFRKAVTIDIYK
jgi:hypothetical protein